MAMCSSSNAWASCILKFPQLECSSSSVGVQAAHIVKLLLPNLRAHLYLLLYILIPITLNNILYFGLSFSNPYFTLGWSLISILKSGLSYHTITSRVIVEFKIPDTIRLILIDHALDREAGPTSGQ